jgi:hypothetical protein
MLEMWHQHSFQPDQNLSFRSKFRSRYRINFSRHGAVRNTFWMSHAKIFISFNAAIVSAILTEARETTDEYVMVDVGASVLRPSATSLALRR